jgi:hypothetical protein
MALRCSSRIVCGFEELVQRADIRTIFIVCSRECDGTSFVRQLETDFRNMAERHFDRFGECGLCTRTRPRQIFQFLPDERGERLTRFDFER